MASVEFTRTGSDEVLSKRDVAHVPRVGEFVDFPVAGCKKTRYVVAAVAYLIDSDYRDGYHKIGVKLQLIGTAP